MVEKEQVVFGAMFIFDDGPRQVTAVEHGQVEWIYADRILRRGQRGGRQKLKHFARKAKGRYNETPREAMLAGLREGANPSSATKFVLIHIYVVITIVGILAWWWFFKK